MTSGWSGAQIATARGRTLRIMVRVVRRGKGDRGVPLARDSNVLRSATNGWPCLGRYQMAGKNVARIHAPSGRGRSRHFIERGAECHRNALPEIDRNCPRSVSAGTPLHARAGPKVAR